MYLDVINAGGTNLVLFSYLPLTRIHLYHALGIVLPSLAGTEFRLLAVEVVAHHGRRQIV